MSDEKIVGTGGERHVCPACGAVFTGHFCPDCGKKVEEDITFCPVCGESRPHGKNFCANCGFSFIENKGAGERVAPPTVETPVAPTKQEVPVETQAPAPKAPAPRVPTPKTETSTPKAPTPRVSTPKTETSTPKKQPTQKKKLNPWWIVAISAVLVVAIIIGAVAIFGGSGSGEIEEYVRDGDYIYFGEYPQTIKADGVTITDTQDGRGYFLGSDGAYYAKVVASPSGSSYTFSNSATIVEGTTYYFKVEPIRWRILSESDGTALILCDSILADMEYDAGNNNNYAESDIRAWLNNQFYNTAFTDLQKDLILTTTVDNSAASTGVSSNSYACENTQDKVFLLSYVETIKSVYDFSALTGYDEGREIKVDDYARATGAYINTTADNYGNGNWWLRSPYSTYSDYVWNVNNDGRILFMGGDYSHNGVVPALQIRL